MSKVRKIFFYRLLLGYRKCIAVANPEVRGRVAAAGRRIYTTSMGPLDEPILTAATR
jgi:hypothetical protein